MGLLVQPLIRTPFITQRLEAPILTGGSDDVLAFWWPVSPQNLGQVVLNTSEYSLHWSIMWLKYMATDSTG